MDAISEAPPLVPERRSLYRRITGAIGDQMPKGLYARALIIIIAPMVLLQSVLTFVFLERHWQTVTRRLSTVTVQNIAMLIDIYRHYPQDADAATLTRLAEDDLGLRVRFVPGEELPIANSKPFFDLLDTTLSDEITRQIGRPFWIDTVGRSNFVDIRIKLEDGVMHVLARRSQTYASNSQIFLLWMVGTSLVLLTVAILFLRNQIKPILRLSEAAESFGKGRPPPEDFRPRGAREVRQAANAFIEMRDRIERHVEQRTVMLAGVSHDLRTVLTRFRLQLALFEDSPELEALRNDIDEMHAMLEDYMAFAKGGSGEDIVRVDIAEILGEVKTQAHGAKDVAIEIDNAPAHRPAPPPCLQARGGKSRQQCRALRRARQGHGQAPGRLAHRCGRGRRSRASPRPNVSMCSAPSTGSIMRATRIRARPGLGSRSLATLPASMAAISRLANPRSAA